MIIAQTGMDSKTGAGRLDNRNDLRYIYYDMPYTTTHTRRLIRFALTVMLLTTCATAEAGGEDYWTPLTSPTSRALRQMHFLDSLTGWIVGDGGTILHTT